jgi:branched-chain amino acid transport system permease protein
MTPRAAAATATGPSARRVALRPRAKALAWCGCVAAFALVPFLFDPYRVGQFTLVVIYAIALLGLNLLLGYGGQISLGHGAFFAIGAYAGAITIDRTDLPALAALPVAALASGLAGGLVGLPALRIRGIYLALVTLSVALVVPQLVKRFDELTGGAQGMQVDQPVAPAWLGLEDDQFLHLLALAVAVPMFLLAANLVRGGVGRALLAVRENELAAVAMGVDLARYKTGAFAIAAAYAGVGGALFTFANGFVAPESFTLVLSFGFLAAVVVGGLGTIAGAVFGALFLEFVPVYASDVDEALGGVIYGAVLIACMYALPDGVTGLGRRLGSRLRGRRAKAGTHAAAPQVQTTREEE